MQLSKVPGLGDCEAGHARKQLLSGFHLGICQPSNAIGFDSNSDADSGRFGSDIEDGEDGSTAMHKV